MRMPTGWPTKPWTRPPHNSPHLTSQRARACPDERRHATGTFTVAAERVEQLRLACRAETRDRHGFPRNARLDELIAIGPPEIEIRRRARIEPRFDGRLLPAVLREGVTHVRSNFVAARADARADARDQ